jgi:hypothetical protein
MINFYQVLNADSENRVLLLTIPELDILPSKYERVTIKDEQFRVLDIWHDYKVAKNEIEHEMSIICLLEDLFIKEIGVKEIETVQGYDDVE